MSDRLLSPHAPDAPQTSERTHHEGIENGVAALTLSLSVLVPAAAADATPSSTGSGSFTTTVQITSVSQVDGNTIVSAIQTQTLSGFLNGTRVASGVEIHHVDGTFEAHDSGTFTGTVNGRSGTVAISGSSTGSGSSGTGQFEVDQGTDGLTGLCGHGTFLPMITGPNTAAGTYQLDHHFES
jgi:hypothetical protein